MQSRDSRPKSAVVAIIADLVGSRKLTPVRRRSTQLMLDRLMQTLNATYAHEMLAEFVVTLGDEFQGVLRSEAKLAAILQDIQGTLDEVPIRIAVSRGRISTALKTKAIGSDGPAWYNARDLLEKMRKLDRAGVAFTGFGDERDIALNAIAGLLAYQWGRMRRTQRLTVERLRKGARQRSAIAAELRVSPQSLSNRIRSAGFREFEAGWAAISRLSSNRAGLQRGGE